LAEITATLKAWELANDALDHDDSAAAREAERAAWHAYLNLLDPFDALAEEESDG
jgi:hypothetical protein